MDKRHWVLLSMLSAPSRYKNGQEILPSGRFRVLRNEDKVQLVIKDLHEGDTGDITCELSNKKGVESATAKLAVQGKIILSLGTFMHKTLYCPERKGLSRHHRTQVTDVCSADISTETNSTEYIESPSLFST